MEIINFFIEFILHLDQYLNEIIQAYGTWTYAILFLIVFIETGLVIMPFLPGDSLLFAAGTFAALGALDVWLLRLIIFVAAVLGDTINYWIGNKIGPRAFDQDLPFLKRDYLEKTQAFYEKHGTGALCTDCAHFCAFRGRRWHNELQAILHIQRPWRLFMGDNFRLSGLFLWQHPLCETEL
jgi:membrane protein YqaA with SNARE-associated domain